MFSWVFKYQYLFLWNQYTNICPSVEKEKKNRKKRVKKIGKFFFLPFWNINSLTFPWLLTEILLYSEIVWISNGKNEPMSQVVCSPDVFAIKKLKMDRFLCLTIILVIINTIIKTILSININSGHNDCYTLVKIARISYMASLSKWF